MQTEILGIIALPRQRCSIISPLQKRCEKSQQLVEMPAEPWSG